MIELMMESIDIRYSESLPTRTSYWHRDNPLQFWINDMGLCCTNFVFLIPTSKSRRIAIGDQWLAELKRVAGSSGPRREHNLTLCLILHLDTKLRSHSELDSLVPSFIHFHGQENVRSNVIVSHSRSKPILDGNSRVVQERPQRQSHRPRNFRDLG